MNTFQLTRRVAALEKPADWPLTPELDAAANRLFQALLAGVPDFIDGGAIALDKRLKNGTATEADGLLMASLPAHDGVDARVYLRAMARLLASI